MSKIAIGLRRSSSLPRRVGQVIMMSSVVLVPRALWNRIVKGHRPQREDYVPDELYRRLERSVQRLESLTVSSAAPAKPKR